VQLGLAFVLFALLHQLSVAQVPHHVLELSNLSVVQGRKEQILPFLLLPLAVFLRKLLGSAVEGKVYAFPVLLVDLFAQLHTPFLPLLGQHFPLLEVSELFPPLNLLVLLKSIRLRFDVGAIDGES